MMLRGLWQKEGKNEHIYVRERGEKILRSLIAVLITFPAQQKKP
jgi:hypothetical protein